MIDYKLASTPEEYQAARNLFMEYAKFININLDFQSFEEELGDVTKKYSRAAGGGVILCKNNNTYIACVAIRKQDEGIAELKRMFVQPGNQNLGLGKTLLTKAIDLAKTLGYTKMRLDTLDTMTHAIHLYRAFGFKEIDAYYYNPIKNAIYFEKQL